MIGNWIRLRYENASPAPIELRPNGVIMTEKSLSVGQITVMKSVLCPILKLTAAGSGLARRLKVMLDR
jgi:hypothetical protein